jgi:hypothetical protein
MNWEGKRVKLITKSRAKGYDDTHGAYWRGGLPMDEKVDEKASATIIERVGAHFLIRRDDTDRVELVHVEVVEVDFKTGEG